MVSDHAFLMLVQAGGERKRMLVCRGDHFWLLKQPASTHHTISVNVCVSILRIRPTVQRLCEHWSLYSYLGWAGNRLQANQILIFMGLQAYFYYDAYQMIAAIFKLK